MAEKAGLIKICLEVAKITFPQLLFAYEGQSLQNLILHHLFWLS